MRDKLHRGLLGFFFLKSASKSWPNDVIAINSSHETGLSLASKNVGMFPHMTCTMRAGVGGSQWGKWLMDRGGVGVGVN